MFHTQRATHQKLTYYDSNIDHSWHLLLLTIEVGGLGCSFTLSESTYYMQTRCKILEQVDESIKWLNSTGQGPIFLSVGCVGLKQ